MNVHELQETLVKTTKILAGKNLPVHLEGFAPRVEYDPATKQPTRIFIPAVPEGMPPKLIDAIHGYIDHECSHIKFSDSEDICDGTKDKLWHYVHNCIEDPRVNKKMGEFYPGAKKNIKRGYDYLFNDMADKDGPSAYSKEYVDGLDLTDPKKLAEFHLQYAPLWFAGKMGCPLSREKFHELKLDNFYEEIMDKADPEMLANLDKIDTAEDVRALSDYWSGFFSEEALKKMQPDECKGKGKPSREESDKLMEGFKTMEDQLAEEIEKKIKYGVIKSKEGIYWTDRWDKYYNKHDIGKLVRGSYAGYDVASFEEKTKLATNYLAKDLRRLLEEQRRRYYVGGYKSGKINSKSLFSVRCGNDRIFKKKNSIRDVNACVSLLIDMSGSMSGEKIKVAMQSAYAFAMTLQQLKVPFEVFGFVTENHDYEMIAEWGKFAKKNGPAITGKVINTGCPEYIYAFKSFDESFDIISKQAMTACSARGIPLIQNEDSKHVMLALKRLSARPELVKALFVFSDGQPAYPGPVQNSCDQLKYLGKNAKSKFGVDIYSIGIQSSSVQNFYPQYKIVTNIQDLPKALFEFLRKIF
jgi:hypothetical protein